MSKDKEQQPELKPAVTIKTMASMLGLSRSRFRDLVKSGFFLMPLYSLSKRPFYSAQMQLQNLEARESQIGVNGQFVMFYSKRKKSTRKLASKPHVSQKKNEITPILERLKQLGVHTTQSQAEKAVKESFPEGIQDIDEMTIVKAVMRYLRRPNTQ